VFSRFLHPRRGLAAITRRPRTAGDPGEMPLENAAPRRTRTRRGGPRTPLPLVGLVAVCAGIGVAYVGQVAHSTQATYEASHLQSQQMDLRSQAARLDDDLNRLRATERIVAAAQHLGMRPPGSWAYVATSPLAPVAHPHNQLASQQTPSDPVQRLIAGIGGFIGVGDTGTQQP
jgi:hypothetical protein